LTEHWLFPIALAFTVCVTIGAMATLTASLRRHVGDDRADVVGGVVMALVLGYIIIGAGLAVFMAFSPVVQHADIEYDSREFLR